MVKLVDATMVLKPGDILYSALDKAFIMVVMANDEGVRYYEPSNPTIDDNGHIETAYMSKATLVDFCFSLGEINDYVDVLEPAVKLRMPV